MRTALLFLTAFLGTTAQAQGKKGFLSLEDYPPKALAEGREGKAKVELTIRVDGRVSACRILESSGHADLDQATCKVMTKRAIFKPETDAAGKAIEGHVTTSVTWTVH